MTKAYKRVIEVEDSEESQTIYVHLDKIASVKVDGEGNVWIYFGQHYHYLTGRGATEFLALYETWLDREATEWWVT